MELSLMILGMALAACLKPAFNNRWLRADPNSRFGLGIAFGTIGCFVGVLVVLAVLVVRGVWARL
jgi:uncharacterized membrane protein (DUF485 family)